MCFYSYCSTGSGDLRMVWNLWPLEMKSEWVFLSSRLLYGLYAPGPGVDSFTYSSSSESDSSPSCVSIIPPASHHPYSTNYCASRSCDRSKSLVGLLTYFGPCLLRRCWCPIAYLWSVQSLLQSSSAPTVFYGRESECISVLDGLTVAQGSLAQAILALWIVCTMSLCLQMVVPETKV